LASWKRLELLDEDCRVAAVVAVAAVEGATSKGQRFQTEDTRTSPDRAQRNPFEQTTRRVRLKASRRSIHLNRLKGFQFCFFFF